MSQKNTRTVLLILIMLLYAGLHTRIYTLNIIGFHSWRQTQTQTVIDNFYEEDGNILNPRINSRGAGDGIFRTDFPLMQWLISKTYFVFGQDITTTRFAMLLITLTGFLFFYFFLRNIFKHAYTPVAGATLYLFSPLLYYYGVNPLVDVFATMMLAMGLYAWSRHNRNKQQFGFMIWAVAAFSVAGMIKTPFFLFNAGPAVYLYMLDPRKGIIPSMKLIRQYIMLLIAAVPALTWIIWVIPQIASQGNPVIEGVFGKAFDAGAYFGYLTNYVVGMLPGVLLGYVSTILFIISAVFIFRKKAYRAAPVAGLLTILILLCIYIIYEANTLRNAHDYYFMPFIPLLFTMCAYGIDILLERSARFDKPLVAIVCIAAPVIAFTRMDARWNEKKPGFNVDLYNNYTTLRTLTPQDALIVCGNDESKQIWPYYLDKKGWVFLDNKLDSVYLQERVKEGAEYLYTDAPDSILQKIPASMIDTTLYNAGSIKVFKLKR